jgi:hypothetical protein
MSGKTYEVTQKLEIALGPDTTDLTMRMGLHRYVNVLMCGGYDLVLIIF